MCNATTPYRCVLSLVVTMALLVAFARPVAAAEPPEYFQRLIDRGNVTLEYYEPGQGPRDHAAFTTYELFVRHDAVFRINWTDRRRVRYVTIRPTLTNIEYELTNKVLLSKYLNHNARWKDSLVRHEFDHVAVTVDPRIRMLIERLYHDLDRLDRRVAVGTTVDESWALGILDTEYAKRRDAVLRLLKANEHLLDEVTQHGRKPIPDRREFFRQLFTQPNLERLEFVYLNDVAGLLRSRDYREVELPYAMDE